MIVTHDDDLEIDEKKIKIISRNFDLQLQYMNPIKIFNGGSREIPLRKGKEKTVLAKNDVVCWLSCTQPKGKKTAWNWSIDIDYGLMIHEPLFAGGKNHEIEIVSVH